jgi:hypothetical protein
MMCSSPQVILNIFHVHLTIIREHNHYHEEFLVPLGWGLWSTGGQQKDGIGSTRSKKVDCCYSRVYFVEPRLI